MQPDGFAYGTHGRQYWFEYNRKSLVMLVLLIDMYNYVLADCGNHSHGYCRNHLTLANGSDMWMGQSAHDRLLATEHRAQMIVSEGYVYEEIVCAIRESVNYLSKIFFSGHVNGIN